jgi:uncharacterized protein
MKTSLEYLPLNKQAELAKIIHVINEVAQPEMVILFGSYARNEWVEEKYDDEHYRYQSDFDILVIVEIKSEAIQGRFEREIEEKIEKAEDIKTPVSIIVHDIEFVNKRLRKAQYFFTDIKKEGVVLYDSGKLQLKEARELLPAERKKLAQEDFDYWFKKAENFKEGFEFYFTKEKLNEASFLLHQTTERLYSGILLVFTRYKPNTHELAILRKLTNSVDSRLLQIFSLDNPENKRLFKLLRKAYVDARYKPSYIITHDELSQLYKQVEELKKIGELICKEKIENFVQERT